VQWLPTASFEFEYRLIDNMTFGQALEALKYGKKVARYGWNGKNMRVILIDDAVEIECDDNDNEVELSVSDLLAEDWFIVN
jgi:hypothetical protein